MERRLEIAKVEGVNNIADIATKAVTTAVLRNLLPRAGMFDLDEVKPLDESKDSKVVASLGRCPGGGSKTLSALALFLQVLSGESTSERRPPDHESSDWLLIWLVGCTTGFWILVVTLLSRWWFGPQRSLQETKDQWTITEKTGMSELREKLLLEQISLERREIEEQRELSIVPATMFTTTTGKCYHSRQNCRGLSNAKEIRSFVPCSCCVAVVDRRSKDDPPRGRA